MNIFQYLLSGVLNFFHLPNNTQPNPNQLTNGTQPNIIVIMTDDMGWNDVSYHGSNEIPTPNIDALAYSGVILSRHYALPTCTPSRAAFLTSRYPIRMGLQGAPIGMAEPRGIPWHEKLLPEYLKELGYITRLVGKWHLGYYTEKHTPTHRGFDSFAGYYGGYIKYFKHVITKNKHTGIDLHTDTPKKLEPYNNDQYFTDFVTEHATDLIKNHDKQKPLYLQISHLAPHASENVDRLEVKNMSEVNKILSYIPHVNRRKYAGMLTEVDESVGKVVEALAEAKMLDNSVIIFTPDNGASTADEPFSNYGSNYPLRGMKATLFEGGVRVPAFVFSPLIKNKSRVSKELVHITDWLPTLYSLAGGDVNNLQGIDGVDQWSTVNGITSSKRNSILLNIDEIYNMEAAIFDNFKLLKGPLKYDGYYGGSGEDYSPRHYDVHKVMSSPAGKALKTLSGSFFPNEKQILKMRSQSTETCERVMDFPRCDETCLFNIVEDPCETTDVSEEHPEMLATLSILIKGYRSVLMRQTNTYIDPKGYPDNFNGYWMPWLQNEYIPPKDVNLTEIYSEAAFCEGFPVDDPRHCL